MNYYKQRDEFIISLLEKGLKKGMTVLDIGCGSGDISFIAAKLVGERGKVIRSNDSYSR